MKTHITYFATCTIFIIISNVFSNMQISLMRSTIERSAIPISFQQCVDEEDWIRTDLKVCKSRSISRNQLHKINLPSNALNSANITRGWTKTSTKRSECSRAFQQYANQTKLTNIEFKMLENKIVHLGWGFRWKTVTKDVEVDESLD